MLALLAAAVAASYSIPEQVWDVPEDRVGALLAVDLAAPVLYPSFAAAAAAAPTPVLGAPEILDVRSRALDDRVVQRLALRPERPALLRALLDRALQIDRDGEVVAWLATALQLGGVPLDGMSLAPPTLEKASRDAAAFRQKPAGRAIGPWDATPELRDAWARDRWVSLPVRGELARGLARLLEDPALDERIGAERALFHGLGPVFDWPSPLEAPEGPCALWPSPPQTSVDTASPVQNGPLPARRAWAYAGLGFGDEQAAYTVDLSPSMGSRYHHLSFRHESFELVDPVRHVVPPRPEPWIALAEPFPTWFQRTAEIGRWAAEQPWAQATGTSEDYRALAELADAHGVLAEQALGRPGHPVDPVAFGLAVSRSAPLVAGLPAQATEDVRAAVPIRWQEDGRPLIRAVLGVRVLPVELTCDTCTDPLLRTILLPVTVDLEVDRLPTRAELTALVDADPRPGPVVEGLPDARRVTSSSCSHASGGAFLPILVLARVRRRSGSPGDVPRPR